MTSSPPGTHDALPPAFARLTGTGTSGLGEGVIFFSVEGAPRQACRTRTGPDGTLSFHTSLSGRVVEVRSDELVLEVGAHRVVVRHLLPAAVDLSELRDHRLLIGVQQRYRGRGRATIDAEIRDRAGRLLLWAHDGRFPEDREARGLALRASLDPGRDQRLALVHETGVASLSAPGHARVRRDGVPHDALLLRLGPDDVSLVLLRRR
jgi:hypothetical protein